MLGGKMTGLTLEQIEDRLITHYARRFRTDPNSISATTDLKQRFNFTSASWSAEAEPLSDLFGVRIAQSAMSANTTVDKLSRLIKKKSDAAAAPTAKLPVRAKGQGKPKAKALPGPKKEKADKRAGASKRPTP
jgi:hypothetical protein